MHGHSCLRHPGPPATAEEKTRIKRLFTEVGCICCLLRFGTYNGLIEVHHIVRGNKRIGHWYTLPLCRAHHQTKGEGVWTSIANGRKAFAAIHGSEFDLWLKVQHMLKLDDELPSTKILPRREYVANNKNLVDVPAGASAPIPDVPSPATELPERATADQCGDRRP